MVKIYCGKERLIQLQKLAQLYRSIDTTRCGFDLPEIFEIYDRDEVIGVKEKRLPGVTLESKLGETPLLRSYKVVDLYFDTISELRQAKLRVVPSQYSLLGDSVRSSLSLNAWSDFYAGQVERKINSVKAVLTLQLRDFDKKAATLLKALRAINCSEFALIHGDFHPGNLLVSEDLSRATGILDFGTFTMFGDGTLDVAAAFGFYDMYSEDRVRIRKEILPIALSKLESHPRDFFCYLLSYAILTCDLYVKGEDYKGNGHFQWAVEILANDEYWHEALQGIS